MTDERLTEEQGRQRLLDAAVQLALELGGPDFTVRQVAAKAGLNHGLVHRYFGTKDVLTSAVIKSIGCDLASELQGGPGAVSMINDRRAQVLALLVAQSSAAHHLDQEMVEGIQPVVERLGRAPGEIFDKAVPDPETRAAIRLATILGWVSNEKLITRACGLGSEQRAELVSTIESVA